MEKQNPPRRNHYIPKFLLDRFASKSEPSKKLYFIWQFSKNRTPAQIGTKDAAVGKDFYGKDSSTVEIPFSGEEGVYAAAIKSAESGEELTEEIRESLRRLVWMQAVRTRSIREQFRRAMEDLLSELHVAAGTEESKIYMRKHLDESMDRMVSEEVEKLPIQQRAAALALYRQGPLRELLKEKAMENLKSFDLQIVTSLFMKNFRETNAGLRAAESGQIKGLSSLLNDKEVPGSFKPKRWLVMESKRKMILGDSCVVATNSNGEVGTIFKYGPDWKELYLPISPEKVLVALADDGNVPTLTEDRINYFSAATANEFFYASQNTEQESSLTPLISQVPIMTRAEVTEIVGNSWSK